MGRWGPEELCQSLVTSPLLPISLLPFSPSPLLLLSCSLLDTFGDLIDTFPERIKLLDKLLRLIGVHPSKFSR